MKTRHVLNLGFCTYGQLVGAIRSGKIPAPLKDVSGDYSWSAEDVERLRQAVAVDRRRRPVGRVAS